MANVLVADGHPVARAGYKVFLESEPRISKVCDAGNEAETVALLRTQTWDLLVLAVQLPEVLGLELLPRVRAEHPHLIILATGPLPEDSYAQEVMRLGASGYYSKENTPDEFLRIVRSLLGKRGSTGESLSPAMPRSADANGDRPLHARLSAREFQIFCRLASGAGILEIGRELGISAKTVSTHRSRILDKMRVKTNAHMTAYALRNGIIP